MQAYSFERRYLDLLEECLAQGEPVEGRNGNTLSMFGKSLEFRNLEDCLFPLLTTRKMHIDGILGELAAFVRGCSQVSDFKNYGCNYWDANAEAWGKPGSVGKIYGGQWRDFNGVDQLKELVTGLREAPTSRRHVLTTYNPAETQLGCLPPCHLLAQFSVRRWGYLECCVYMRSVDLCVGLPTDVALYSTLVIVLAEQLGLYPGAITFFFGDAHIYENHKAQVYQQLERWPHRPPTFIVNNESVQLEHFVPDDISIIGYQHHDPIKYTFNV
jgi:thymidylate synthase